MPQVAANAQPVYVYSHCAASTTTVVKTGGGVLHRLVVNTTGAGALTIYDAVTAVPPVIAVFAAPAAGQTIMFELTFAIGLTVVTTAGMDVTIAYN